jgi:4-hydroxy-tetrahydrodipicolinate reductase
MTRAIMNGCNGKMGQCITGICAQDEDIEIVAGIDTYDGIKNDYPVFASLKECTVDADVIIDFSNAKAVDALLAYGVEKQIPIVLCTTGLSEQQLADVEKAYEKVAILKSANMSLGINTLMELLKKAAQVFAPAGFDMEIVEKHHNQKLDAPSGTALALADSMNEALDEAYTYTYDRSQKRQKRDKYEIGISAVRGGNIVGEHEVIFAGQDEVIEFKHTVPIQSGIHDRFSVLADCRTSCLNHSFNIRKLFSLLSLCHRTNLQDMNTAPGFCFVVHIIDNIRIVCYRLCIRHGQHCRISTMRSGLHPGINILFLFKSRIAEMYMHINKSRHHITSVRIDHTFGFFFRKFFSNLFYLLIFDQDICHLIHLCCRIDDMSPFD